MTDCCLNCKYHKMDFFKDQQIDVCTYDVYIEQTRHGDFRKWFKKVSPNGWCKDWRERRKEQ